ncbi:MAG: thiamine pyrophosphate-binding protein [Anaerolineae bacterium]|nr:thiamine pyrophosphate-binding protein [Anaerolineae bacterium]
MPRMRGADALARSLQANQVDTVFTLPGAQVMPAFDALYDLRDTIQLIHTRHEQATTYMAYGFARATRRPGVAMVVPGPGLLNAAAGLGTAYAASTPVLLLAGQINTGEMGKYRGQLHEVDNQLDMLRPITKWSHMVTHPGEIPEAIREAFRQMLTGRARPVELEIPPDVMRAEAEIDLLPAEHHAPKAADPALIDEAARRLAVSDRPCILAGGGALLAGAWEELRALAEFLQAPVMLMPESKGVFPEDHPLFAGTNPGYFYTKLGPAHRIVPQSDAIVAIGTRFLIGGLQIGPEQNLIQIDIDPREIGKNYPASVGIEADAKAALGQLLEALRKIASPKPDRSAEAGTFRRDYEIELRGYAPAQGTIIDALRAELPASAMVISGMTNIGYWSNLMLPFSQPDTYVTSSYFGTLGYAFPTGLGAQIGANRATPGKRVVAITGDGGFLYATEELSTAKRFGINLLTIVFNNSAYGASQWDQGYNFDERVIGTSLTNPDFVRLAEAYGVRGMRTDQGGFHAALHEALQIGEPVVLEVTLPNMMPPFQLPR